MDLPVKNAPSANGLDGFCINLSHRGRLLSKAAEIDGDVSSVVESLSGIEVVVIGK